MSFYDLSENLMSVYLTIMFLLLCGGTACLVLLIKRKQPFSAAVMFLGSMSMLVMIVLYASNMLATLTGRKVPESTVWFSGISLNYVTIAVLGVLAIEIIILIGEYHFRKNSISHASIKESFDHLNTGLCFSYPNGLVMLINHRMLELSFVLLGKDIQNAKRFWAILQEGEVNSEVQRISYGETPEFLFPDGTIWTFRQEILKGAVQITAADTTTLYRLIDRLKEENRNLEAMCRRIHDYGDKVNQYVISRERLETRVNLHSFLGQALLTTRHFIQYENGSEEKMLDMWQRNIDVLKLEAAPDYEMDSFSELKENAKVVGIEVKVEGNIPYEPQIKRILASAGVEAVINAGKHANAKNLFIKIEDSEKEYIARYTNDGKIPSSNVCEGGGLGSLRAKVERLGGTMEIFSTPRFVLTIILGKEVSSYD